jgi:membrane fusion protein (multidrug efflux system)
MNRIKLVLRRLVIPVILLVVLLSGVVFGMYKMKVDIPALNTTKIYAYLDILGVRAEHWKVYLVSQYESRFHKQEEAHEEQTKILVTRPIAMDVNVTQDYVCQIHSKRHIEVRAMESGYLKEILVKEGQAVKEKDVLFEVVPILYKARLNTELAEMNLAELELKFSKTLAEKNAVSPTEVSLYQAKLARAQAKADLARAELDFASVKAPFDGIIDRLHEMQGSLVKEGDILTTLSDNSVMWVYFNVTEKRYFEYMAETDQNKLNLDVKLLLANHNEFPHAGKIDTAHNIGAIEANFNNQTGNIKFRADFPNPERLLRHGQTGTVRITRELKGAIVIPQRATFELLDKRYVFVVDKKDNVAHQREFEVQYEKDDIFVVAKGLDVNDRIVFEGVREVRDGDPVEFEFIEPEEVLKHTKFRAE